MSAPRNAIIENDIVMHNEALERLALMLPLSKRVRETLALFVADTSGMMHRYPGTFSPTTDHPTWIGASVQKPSPMHQCHGIVLNEKGLHTNSNNFF